MPRPRRRAAAASSGSPPQTRTCAQDRARRTYGPGNQAIGRWRSLSRIKHDLHKKTTQSAHSPAKPACGSRVQRLPTPDAHMCPEQGAQDIRAWETRHRSVEVAVLTFRAWHVCARCHRKKKNLCETLRSGSELLSLSDRILLLVACRPRARVKRACAVGMARRGAQTGRRGAPCKAGQALVRTRHC